MSMTITFSDNKTFSLITAYGRSEMVSSLSDLLTQSEREVIELHFNSAEISMNDLQNYYINPDESTSTITITDESGNTFLHKDYIIPVKFSMEYVGEDTNPHVILVLAQLNETDKSLREVAGLQKVYTGTDLEIAIAKKLDELSTACHETIELGVIYDGSHYSLTEQDQTNILAWSSRAAAGKSVPYHANGEFCRPYTAEEFLGLVDAAVGLIAHHTTYCNMMMKYVKTLTNITEINAITYGVTELTGEYLERYNENMALLTE